MPSEIIMLKNLLVIACMGFIRIYFLVFFPFGAITYYLSKAGDKYIEESIHVN